ncbi:hypothetical protein, partial [uncultured Weissella sp.]|uniref:hypothetical protein n=1 Tax=uncultured Weissella sp. TaxID=253243 RepID=UPI00259A334E
FVVSPTVSHQPTALCLANDKYFPDHFVSHCFLTVLIVNSHLLYVNVCIKQKPLIDALSSISGFIFYVLCPITTPLYYRFYA